MDEEKFKLNLENLLEKYPELSKSAKQRIREGLELGILEPASICDCERYSMIVNENYETVSIRSIGTDDRVLSRSKELFGVIPFEHRNKRSKWSSHLPYFMRGDED